MSAAICAAPPPGLVGWWPAEGTVSDIAGTNNGSLQGGASANAVGLVGTSFGFDGTNNYVQIPDAPTFHPSNLTIEAWVRFSSLDSAGLDPSADQFFKMALNDPNIPADGRRNLAEDFADHGVNAKNPSARDFQVMQN